MDKFLKARIRAQRIKARSQEHTRIESFFITLFKPRHRLILIAQGCIDRGNFRCVQKPGAERRLRSFSSFIASARLFDAA